MVKWRYWSAASSRFILTAALLLATAGPERAMAAPSGFPEEPNRPARHETAKLIVKWCSAAAPERCETHEFPLAEAPVLCVPPSELARVVPPNWRIAAWRCVRRGDLAQGPAFD